MDVGDERADVAGGCLGVARFLRLELGEERLRAGRPGGQRSRKLAGSNMNTETDTPLLRVSGLTKRFGARFACRDVSFEIFPGEVLCVVGESGSGKTTLLKCISAQLEPDHGSVEFDTRDQGLADI